jgi:hypothetical protein
VVGLVKARVVNRMRSGMRKVAKGFIFIISLVDSFETKIETRVRCAENNV